MHKTRHNNQNSRCTKLENVGVLATRVWMEQWSINNHDNPDCEFSLELGQNSKLSACRSKLRTQFWPTIMWRPAITEREEETWYFCRSYSLAPVQLCKVDQNKNRRMVHFIILMLETSAKIIARKDKGKKVMGIKCVENMLALGQFYRRTIDWQFS